MRTTIDGGGRVVIPKSIRDGLVVAVPDEGMPTLDAELVRETLERTRR